MVKRAAARMHGEEHIVNKMIEMKPVIDHFHFNKGHEACGDTYNPKQYEPDIAGASTTQCNLNHTVVHDTAA